MLSTSLPCGGYPPWIRSQLVTVLWKRLLQMAFSVLPLVASQGLSHGEPTHSSVRNQDCSGITENCQILFGKYILCQETLYGRQWLPIFTINVALFVCRVLILQSTHLKLHSLLCEKYKAYVNSPIWTLRKCLCWSIMKGRNHLSHIPI